MLRFLVAIAGILTVGVACSQVHRSWVNSFAGPRPGLEWPESVGLDPQGRPQAMAMANYPDGWAATLLRYETDGRLQSETRVSFEGLVNPEPLRTVYGPDGSVYSVGLAVVWPGDSTHRLIVMKFDPDGTLAWKYAHPLHEGGFYSEGRAVAIDRHGNVYAGGMIVDQETPQGHIPADALILKLSQDGSLLWQRRYNGRDSLTDRSLHLVVDNERNALYSVGSTGVEGNPPGHNRSSDILVLKYDLDGALQWARQWGGPGNMSESAVSTALLSNGTLIVSGSSPMRRSPTYRVEAVLLAYSPEGDETAVFLNDNIGQSSGHELGVTSTGEIAVGGAADELDNRSRAAVWFLDSDFNVLWRHRVAFTDRDFTDVYVDLSVDSHGIAAFGTVMTATSAQDAVTARYSFDGRLLWADIHNAPANNVDAADDVIADGRGNVYATGSGGFVPGHGPDIFLIKYCTLPGDANRDGRVDSFDLEFVLERFGQSTGLPVQPTGDLNGDRIIDDIDLAIVLTCYGRECGD